MQSESLSKLARLVVVAIIFYAPLHCSANPGTPPSCEQNDRLVSLRPVCDDPLMNRQVKEALGLVCNVPRNHGDVTDNRRVVVIGFLGGFVKHSDRQHPEVWFADYLRQHYSSPICVAVFSNHERRAAVNQIVQLLDTDSDGALSESEKEQARIIVYGHSWGASETTAFARDLGQRGIPVLLTIQVDIVAKPHQKPSIIPSNVEQAINFFQSEGLLQGKEEIVAADPTKTRILGNIRMTYGDHPIDCGNFPWLARTFNKPHHEIENDRQVWSLIRDVIDADLGGQTQARLAPFQ